MQSCASVPATISFSSLFIWQSSVFSSGSFTRFNSARFAHSPPFPFLPLHWPQFAATLSSAYIAERAFLRNALGSHSAPRSCTQIHSGWARRTQLRKHHVAPFPFLFLFLILIPVAPSASPFQRPLDPMREHGHQTRSPTIALSGTPLHSRADPALPKRGSPLDSSVPIRRAQSAAAANKSPPRAHRHRLSVCLCVWPESQPRLLAQPSVRLSASRRYTTNRPGWRKCRTEATTTSLWHSLQRLPNYSDHLTLSSLYFSLLTGPTSLSTRLERHNRRLWLVQSATRPPVLVCNSVGGSSSNVLRVRLNLPDFGCHSFRHIVNSFS